MPFGTVTLLCKWHQPLTQPEPFNSRDRKSSLSNSSSFCFLNALHQPFTPSLYGSISGSKWNNTLSFLWLTFFTWPTVLTADLCWAYTTLPQLLSHFHICELTRGFHHLALLNNTSLNMGIWPSLPVLFATLLCVSAKWKSGIMGYNCFYFLLLD